MVAQPGKTFLLKRGDGATSEAFTDIGGFRTNASDSTHSPIDVTNKSSGNNRTLLNEAGIFSMSTSGSGVFEDSAAFGLAEADHRAGTIGNWQIVVPGFGTYEGAFKITTLGFAGEHEGELTYNIALESSGAVTFTST